jgi:GNAT superfamily N-acetyltransferase
MRGSEVIAVAALDAAAVAANHELVPLISADRVDRWSARRYWAGRLHRRDRPTFVADVGGRLVGTLSVDLNLARNRHMRIRRWIYLHSLFVQPGARGRGIARRLVRHALQWAARRGAGGAELGMAADNRRARSLYDSFGFEVQEVVMACRLPQSGR